MMIYGGDEILYGIVLLADESRRLCVSTWCIYFPGSLGWVACRILRFLCYEERFDDICLLYLMIHIAVLDYISGGLSRCLKGLSTRDFE